MSQARRVLASACLCLGVSASACYHVDQLIGLVTPQDAGDAPALYVERCSSCHGDLGRGDGLAGRSLDPGPRDFSKAAWQQSTSDDRIRFVIREGGAAAGLSAQMAAQTDLSDAELDSLVAFIRRVGP